MSGSPLTRITAGCESPLAVDTLPEDVNRLKFLNLIWNGIASGCVFSVCNPSLPAKRFRKSERTGAKTQAV